MGNNNMCCTQEEQQKQQQTIGSECITTNPDISEAIPLLHDGYNHMPLQNEFRVQPTIKTIQQHLRIRQQMISDIFNSFVLNHKDLMFPSQMKISLVQKSIIIADNSQQSQLAMSFIKATDFHIDLKLEINQFINYFANLIQKFYKASLLIDEIKMLVLDELFANEGFYNFVKQQYDKGLHSRIIAYRTNIQKIERSQKKQDKLLSILQNMVNKRSPREKLQILDDVAQKLTQEYKNADADKFNELIYDLIVQANIPSFVTEIKLINDFAGEIFARDSLGRYGYVLTAFMGILMLIIQNY
ncbi:unnamed protein product (macronuclear) [Paramecium tetraurelia]|uniref:VPS9 domain-containing protein n=1 Tax=Paramecium tetraurelia TaxID=5888 RepID=A0CGU3_PARTE|nr:uncharacterized protein GSPATT00007450001 [Paramecium tetraurelia]CAK70010.1 unnamed protein product [Paramecium tetraurelia]|eukprot:XP_001437407.1 hypothetical protein (macronuclear) [Paramecium tetraurelia strain d4-2]